jgi:hypothetical protein
MKTAIVAVAGLMMMTGGAEVTSRPQRDPVREGTLAVEGDCQRLVVQGKDVSEDCDERALDLDYRDWSAFSFGRKSGALLVFSGPGSQQVRSGADRVARPVDQVIVTFHDETEKLPAVGSCDFKSALEGASLIVCTASTAHGHYEIAFTTNDDPRR